MKDLLINCYYDGMTLQQAIEFIAGCYRERPTERQIRAAQKSIKSCTNREWC